VLGAEGGIAEVLRGQGRGMGEERQALAPGSRAEEGGALAQGDRLPVPIDHEERAIDVAEGGEERLRAQRPSRRREPPAERRARGCVRPRGRTGGVFDCRPAM
jgi:hypothetical protein